VSDNAQFAGQFVRSIVGRDLLKAPAGGFQLARHAVHEFNVKDVGPTPDIPSLVDDSNVRTWGWSA
jgi:hypothetical protein